MATLISKENDKRELRQAEVHFRRREYATVVRDLAPQIFLYRNDRHYYYLLGVSSLYIGDFSGAHSYLLRARDLDPLNMEILLGLAVSHLWRKETTEALRIWVGIQDKHPSNEKAVKGLNTLKEAPDKVDWSDQLRLGRLRHLYPEPGFDWYGLLRKASFGLAGALLLLAILGVVFAIKGAIERRQVPARLGSEISGAPNSPSRSPSGSETGDDTVFGILPGDSPRFMLSDGDLKASTAEIQRHFREYRDNPARVLLNKIMQSNANQAIKTQLRGLSGHFRTPGFTDFRDNYDFAAVSADPRLYASVFVMWRGKIAELVSDDKAINFSLLIGYESSKVITGKVAVSLGFAANLHNGDSIELIGQVMPIAAKPGFYLQTAAIRMIKGIE